MVVCKRIIRLIPATFYLRNYYANAVAEDVALAEAIGQPVRAQLIEHAAALADNSYAVDVPMDTRLESKATLDYLVETLHTEDELKPCQIRLVEKETHVRRRF
jgi:hypothetical protein